MAKEPRDWWQVHPDDWRELEKEPIPTNAAGPFVLANADKSRTWLSDGREIQRASSHELLSDEDGNLLNELAPGDEAVFWAEA